jgi:deoxyribodipyrimidine photo-lyase
MINPLRIRTLNDQPYKGGAVVYHMCRDLRAHDNDALLYALYLAKERNAPLVVEYVIYNYLWEGATRRFYDWVIASLKEVEHELRNHNIPLRVIIEDKKLFSLHSVNHRKEDVGAIIFDQLPLHFMKKVHALYKKTYHDVPLFEVDAHNCVPVWHLSDKQEFAARTIRGKVYKTLPSYLEPHEKLIKYKENETIMTQIKPVDWDAISKQLICREDVVLPAWIQPGERGAQKILELFLEKKLSTYEEDRNNFTKDGQSNLSPYLSHGNISRRSIVLALLEKKKVSISSIIDEKQNGSNGKLGSAASFVEELVVRAELSENFCFYNSHYDSAEGFPDWAQKELNKAKNDKREYLYTQKEFEEAKTHDEVWNAAQKQMVTHGKMHGYMRMYWAKKILEWSSSPEEAMKIAVYLNDVYELDGRDPNGYVGCAWSIGGLHDRPWFARPVFASIRYMALSGVEKRGDVKTYIDTWLQKTLF